MVGSVDGLRVMFLEDSLDNCACTIDNLLGETLEQKDSFFPIFWSRTPLAPLINTTTLHSSIFISPTV